MIERLKEYWRRHKARYAEGVKRYGLPVVLTSVALNVLMIATIVSLVKLGWQFDSYAADAGLIGGAFALTKPFFPVRVALALLIAPPLVRAWRKMRGLDPYLPLPDDDGAGDETSEDPTDPTDSPDDPTDPTDPTDSPDSPDDPTDEASDTD